MEGKQPDNVKLSENIDCKGTDMEFPIAVHKDDGSVYGVTVPDIPGVHSWGDTIDDAIRNAKEAIVGHVSTLIELGEDTGFTCSTVEELAAQPEYVEAIWALVSVDLSKLDSKPERINISRPGATAS